MHIGRFPLTSCGVSGVSESQRLVWFAEIVMMLSSIIEESKKLFHTHILAVNSQKPSHYFLEWYWENTVHISTMSLLSSNKPVKFKKKNH